MTLQWNLNNTSRHTQKSPIKSISVFLFVADVDIFFLNFEYYHDILNVDKDGGTGDVDKVNSIFNAF